MDFLKSVSIQGVVLILGLVGAGVGCIALEQVEVGIGLISGAVGLVLPQVRLMKGE